MSYHVDTRDERSIRLRPGRGGVSTRAFSSTSRQAISIDSFPSFDGIPSSVQDRRDNLEKKRITKRRGDNENGAVMSFIRKYPLSAAYLSALLIAGSYFQGWLAWIIG